MISTLFHNNLSAELAAEKERTKALEAELIRITKQRDLIKEKWENLNDEVEKLRETNKQFINLNI